MRERTIHTAAAHLGLLEKLQMLVSLLIHPDPLHPMHPYPLQIPP